MKSLEFITEWKNVKADPKLSPIRKQVSRDINKIITQFGLRRKWGAWTGSQLGIQFWGRDDEPTNKIKPGLILASDEYTRLMRKVARQLRKIPNVEKVTHNKNLLNTPDLIITVNSSQ